MSPGQLPPGPQGQRPMNGELPRAVTLKVLWRRPLQHRHAISAPLEPAQIVALPARIQRMPPELFCRSMLKGLQA